MVESMSPACSQAFAVSVLFCVAIMLVHKSTFFGNCSGVELETIKIDIVPQTLSEESGSH